MLRRPLRVDPQVMQGVFHQPPVERPEIILYLPGPGHAGIPTEKARSPRLGEPFRANNSHVPKAGLLHAPELVVAQIPAIRLLQSHVTGQPGSGNTLPFERGSDRVVSAGIPRLVQEGYR